jgi:hypothetical protein
MKILIFTLGLMISGAAFAETTPCTVSLVDNGASGEEKYSQVLEQHLASDFSTFGCSVVNAGMPAKYKIEYGFDCILYSQTKENEAMKILDHAYSLLIGDEEILNVSLSDQNAKILQKGTKDIMTRSLNGESGEFLPSTYNKAERYMLQYVNFIRTSEMNERNAQ